jgi:FixJ family two-component response regulator
VRPPEGRGGAHRSKGLLIAVIDDDASVRRSLARLLGSAGLRVNTFASAQQYVERGGQPAVDCLVLDIHLGGMDGFALHELLKASGDATPSVFMTAFDDAPTRERAQQAGAAGYLRKPFDASRLLEMVFSAVEGDHESEGHGGAPA